MDAHTMDKQALIASLLLVGFENWTEHIEGWWPDLEEPRTSKPTHSYLLYVGGDELYVDFFHEEGCCVDINEEPIDYENYQEAWNHVKALLPTGE